MVAIFIIAITWIVYSYYEEYEYSSVILMGVSFIAANHSQLYQHILSFTSWPRVKRIQRVKKHKAVDHCKDVPTNLSAFRRKWNKVSGIYKITFLPFRMFTYYGSSSNLGIRFKYHYYNGALIFLAYFFVYLDENIFLLP